MAQTPRGEPRSVPDPAGERYDEMLRQERTRQSDLEHMSGWAKPPKHLPSVRFDTPVERVRAAPRRNDLFTVGGQTYRGVDNGRANVLHPVDRSGRPINSAEHQMALRRLALMAESPLGSAAYLAASLAKASQSSRDGALVAGRAVDQVMTGSKSRGHMPSRPKTAPQTQVVADPILQPGIRYRAPNAHQQATGVNSTLTKPLLGTGSKANRRYTPPGHQKGNDRSHLHAKSLGGSGEGSPHLMSLTAQTNRQDMWAFERDVLRRVRAGEVVDYSVVPLYGGPGAPSSVLMSAHGTREPSRAVVIPNRKGPRR